MRCLRLKSNCPTWLFCPGALKKWLRWLHCARSKKLPIIPRGAGTSLSGTVLAVTGGVMIALTRMTKILEIDHRNRRALVEAELRGGLGINAVKGARLYYAPDPSSQSACTIGGNVATNSGGRTTQLKYGVTHQPCARF